MFYKSILLRFVRKLTCYYNTNCMHLLSTHFNNKLKSWVPFAYYLSPHLFDLLYFLLSLSYIANTTSLFIHKARIPARRFSSSTSQHFKMFPPFASNEGYSASGLRYQSDGVRVTHPLPHSIKINIGSVGRREGSVNKQVCILKLFLE